MLPTKRFAATISVAVLCACGDSATTAAPRYPAVAGAYTVTGSFEAPYTDFSGTVTFVQPSREQPVLEGSSQLTAVLPGGPAIYTTISSASVSETGAVGFNFGLADAPTKWRFEGQLTGSTIVGTHTLTGARGSGSGSFTAVKK